MLRTRREEMANRKFGVQTLVAVVADDCAHNGSMNILKLERESYLKGEQQADRLTMKVCHANG